MNREESKKPNKSILVKKKGKRYQKYGILLFTKTVTIMKLVVLDIECIENKIVKKLEVYQNGQTVGYFFLPYIVVKKKGKGYQQYGVLLFTMLKTSDLFLYWNPLLTKTQPWSRNLRTVMRCMT